MTVYRLPARFISNEPPPGVTAYRYPPTCDLNQPLKVVTYEFVEHLKDRYHLDDLSPTKPVLAAVDANWPATPSWSCDNSVPLLELSLGDETHSFFIPVSSFLTTSPWQRESEWDGAGQIVPWEKWKPLITGGEALDITRACGSSRYHIVFENRILDFNQYDAARNIYKPHDHNLRASRGKTSFVGRWASDLPRHFQRSRPIRLRGRHTEARRLITPQAPELNA